MEVVQQPVGQISKAISCPTRERGTPKISPLFPITDSIAA
uniref:Uncharacterized protein n=1 Tax=Pseudomonas aeruginosa TaxID=287 RepID=A0A6C0L1M0_PSEAI|nr:hypothetical protein [Pseudomonas aeruginosa]